MTGTIISKPRALGTAALAFVIASSSTGQADPRAAANIPTTEQKLAGSSTMTEGAATGELSPPYMAWQGTGPPPPTAPLDAELPPPLARARQLPRRPIEASASPAAFFPSCGAGSLDDRGCLTVSPGVGVDLALLYRVRPSFAVGVEGAFSGFAAQGHGTLSGAGGGARFVGVVSRVYFADEGAWDPYLALTVGAGTLQLRAGGDARVSTTGFGGRVAGGIDYVFGTHLRLGPTASFAHWVAWREQSCGGNVCRDERAIYGRLLGFATLGFRLTVSFGDVL